MWSNINDWIGRSMMECRTIPRACMHRSRAKVFAVDAHLYVRGRSISLFWLQQYVKSPKAMLIHYCQELTVNLNVCHHLPLPLPWPIPAAHPPLCWQTGAAQEGLAGRYHPMPAVKKPLRGGRKRAKKKKEDVKNIAWVAWTCTHDRVAMDWWT